MKIGIQLYNFRELFDGTPENFKDVLLKVQSLGYEGVEFAGFYGIVPERIKQILEEIGLEAIGVIVEQDEPSEKGPLEDAERSMRYIRRLF